MSKRFIFNRLEAAGSLGDLGILLPIAIAMVLFNVSWSAPDFTSSAHCNCHGSL